MSDITAADFAVLFVQDQESPYTDDTFRAATAALTPAGKKELYDGLVAFARSYTGTFAPVLSVREWFERNADAKLSFKQCRMVANAIRTETQARRRRDDLDALFPPIASAPKAAPVAPNLPVEEVVPDGYYTVVFDGGSHVTLRVKHWNKVGKPEWVQIVALLTGPENTSDYTGIGFLEGRKVTFWRSFRHTDQTPAVRAVRYLTGSEDAWKTAGVAYARKSEKCFVCNRELTDPLSIELGIGPVCREATGF